MKKILVVVDMQNDFVTGSLGSPQAQAIVPAVKAKIDAAVKEGSLIVFTRDTHDEGYLDTQEGKNLPVPHCIINTEGHQIIKELVFSTLAGINSFVYDKPTFGSLDFADLCKWCSQTEDVKEIEFVGLCTDICVVSNALIMKAMLPEMLITVDAACCAGVTEESHKAALLTMKMCQVNVINEDEPVA